MAKKVSIKREIETVLRSYELMLLMSPELLEAALKKKLKEITSQIEEVGGKITLEDIWGKRKLAYRVKGHEEGIYVVLNAEIPQTFLKELNELLRIDKETLRHLLISIPEDYEYTKYDLDAPKPKKTQKKVSPKREVVKAAAKKAPKKSEDEKAGEEPKELDKKLDSILEGDDLNL